MTVYRRSIVPNPDIIDKERVKPIDILFAKYLIEQDQVLDTVLNRGLKFSDNFNGQFLTFTSSATPNAENTVAHTLKRIPTGFIVTAINKAAAVYNGGTPDTVTDFHLKVNVASTAITVFIF